MDGYTKLFASIIHSTIWQECSHIKLAWISMLAMADQHGEVNASIPGLAKVAGISNHECEDAVSHFLAPDPYSRTPDHEGRRIAVIDGGWRLLNHAKYRDMKSFEQIKAKNAERQQRFRDKLKAKVTLPVTLNNPIAEAEAEAEETTTTTTVQVAALPRIKRPKTPKAPKEAPGMFPKPVIDAVNAICLSCPKEDGDDHRKIRIDAATLADRITGILEASPEVKIEILTQAWTDYLASKPFRVKAPQYFFGKADDNGDGANWRPYARLVWHKLAKLAEKHQQDDDGAACGVTP